MSWIKAWYVILQLELNLSGVGYVVITHSRSSVLRPACGADMTAANLKYATESIQTTVPAHHISNVTRWIICSSYALSFESTLRSFPSSTRKLLDLELDYTISWKRRNCSQLCRPTVYAISVHREDAQAWSSTTRYEQGS